MARKNTRRMLEEQRLVTVAGRGAMLIVLVATLTCSLGLGLLFGKALAMRVLTLGGLALIGLAVPTIRAFSRWAQLRERVRRERRAPRPAEARPSSASRVPYRRAS